MIEPWHRKYIGFCVYYRSQKNTSFPVGVKWKRWRRYLSNRMIVIDNWNLHPSDSFWRIDSNVHSKLGWIWSYCFSCIHSKTFLQQGSFRVALFTIDLTLNKQWLLRVVWRSFSTIILRNEYENVVMVAASLVRKKRLRVEHHTSNLVLLIVRLISVDCSLHWIPIFIRWSCIRTYLFLQIQFAEIYFDLKLQPLKKIYAFFASILVRQCWKCNKGPMPI